MEYKWVIFRKDRICYSRCPVTYFFGITFADKVFLDLKGAYEIKHFRSLGRSKSYYLKFKESKKNIVVFRYYNRDSTIDPRCIINYNKTLREVLEYRIRLGF